MDREAFEKRAIEYLKQIKEEYLRAVLELLHAYAQK